MMRRSAFLRTVLAATLAGFIDVRNLLPEEVSDEEAFGTSVMEEYAWHRELLYEVRRREWERDRRAEEMLIGVLCP